MAYVRAKLDVRKIADPRGRAEADDPWRNFRDIEILDLTLEFRFQHSLGKCSRFFLELEAHRLLGSRCARCRSVWVPPRASCGNDLATTEWVELSGRGRLAAATECTYTQSGAASQPSLVLGYVALDGASTLLLQRIQNFGDVRRLTPGLRVKIAWAQGAVAHPMELFWFEPDE
jgi:uncharacterized OB-fold protein